MSRRSEYTRALKEAGWNVSPRRLPVPTFILAFRKRHELRIDLSQHPACATLSERQKEGKGRKSVRGHTFKLRSPGDIPRVDPTKP